MKLNKAKAKEFVGKKIDCKVRSSEARCYYESVMAWRPVSEPWREEKSC